MEATNVMICPLKRTDPLAISPLLRSTMAMLELTVGVSFIYIFFLYKLHTPSTTHTIHSALDALQLKKEEKKGR
jgi:hypothetical protein